MQEFEAKFQLCSGAEGQSPREKTLTISAADLPMAYLQAKQLAAQFQGRVRLLQIAPDSLPERTRPQKG